MNIRKTGSWDLLAQVGARRVVLSWGPSFPFCWKTRVLDLKTPQERLSGRRGGPAPCPSGYRKGAFLPTHCRGGGGPSETKEVLRAPGGIRGVLWSRERWGYYVGHTALLGSRLCSAGLGPAQLPALPWCSALPRCH